MAGVSGAVDSPLFPFQWLDEEKVIQRLVELIHPSQDEDVSGARSLPRAGGQATPARTRTTASFPSFNRGLTSRLFFFKK